MSGKSIVFTLIGLAVFVLGVFVLRGSPPSNNDNPSSIDGQPRSAAPRASEDGGAARPSVFGAGVDSAARKRPEQATSDPRPRGDATREDGSPSIDLRSRLQDRSRPFAAADDAEIEPGERPPTGSAWRSDDAALAAADMTAPERTDPTQPVLSLFDKDGAIGAADAAIEKGVTFEDDSARFSPESELAIPMAGKISGEAGSLSFWVRPEGDTSDVDSALLAQVRSHYQFNDRLQIWKDGGKVRMVFADSTGNESGALYDSPSWPNDEWRLVTATWGNGENALYVNGELAGRGQFEGQFNIRPDTMLHIGSNYSEDPRSLNGTISQFRVYDRALDVEEISKLPSQYPE